MSSLPGYTLESFVAWQWNLIVEELPESNMSLGIAELLLNAPRRKTMTHLEFKTVLSYYEPYRETIEMRLHDFDEETQSWRTYAECVDCDISDTLQATIKQHIDNILNGET